MEARQVALPSSAREAPGGDAIAHSSERYAPLFTHHPHAVCSLDPLGYCTDANARALELTGLSLERMRRTHFSEVVHPEDLHLVQDRFRRAMAGVPQLVEARVVSAGGDVVDVRSTLIPVVVADEVVGVHGITEDITDARRVLRELDEANAAKTLFLATVSHAVRTPLAALVGATDLLLASDLEPEPDHYVRMVQRSGERLTRLVNDILEFSGLDTHQTVLQPAPFEVRSLVRDVADWAGPLAGARDLRISFVVDDAVPTTAVGDRRRVTQVVTNLVQNAITFTDRGSVDVRVGCGGAGAGIERPARCRGAWVEFTVTDTGVGIAADRVQSLFEPFVQADPLTPRDQAGIGLGLAICRGLVELMGGTLRIRSTPGEGSTFAFAVPLGRVADDPAAPSAEG